jgi:hypothetical protein
MTNPLPSNVAPRSGAVTTVAVANIVLGVLRIAVSALVALLMLNFLLDWPGTDPDLIKLVGLIALVIMLPILLVIGIFSVVAGIVLIIAGMGLLRRRPASRITTLVLGGLGGGLALVYGYQLVSQLIEGVDAVAPMGISLAGFVVHGGYCVLVFVVLLNPRVAAEFRQLESRL